jgi:hypothetical protein
MELNNVEKLLDKYFDGDTSITEENQLKAYFSKNDVPTHLQDYKAMFNYFAINKKEVSQQEIKVNTKKKTFNLKWLLSSAAVITLLIAVFQFLPKPLSNIEKAEAERAFVETKKAFQLISYNLKKGNNAIAYLDHYESTKNKIFKK